MFFVFLSDTTLERILIKPYDWGDATGRSLANQTLLNGSNDDTVQPSIKENIVCAIAIHNITTHKGLLNDTIKQAINARTKGELKEAITKALKIIEGS